MGRLRVTAVREIKGEIAMKKRMIAMLLSAVLLTAAMAPNTVFAAEESDAVSASSVQPVELSGEDSYNKGLNDYSTWSAMVNSYLTEKSDGTIERVEYFVNTNKLLVEDYSSDAKTLRSSKEIDVELDRFGGVFFGKRYNFAVFGQKNPSQNDALEVVRVVKYTKSWERVDAASIYGANSHNIFYCGSLRMDESNNTLFVHTSHEMYVIYGVYHQANMSFSINEDSMKVEEISCAATNNDSGYISHSFNQFVKTDGSYLYRVDHGDAYPRGISLIKTRNTSICSADAVSVPVDLSGTGNGFGNETGASVGGFELSKNGCLIAFNAVDYTKKNVPTDDIRNIYLSCTDKALGNTEVVKYTDFGSGSRIEVSTPQLVKINDDSFLLMWEEINTENETVITKMARINSKGKVDSQGIVSSNYALSDCQPITTKNGQVKWYAGLGDEYPLLYTVDPSNLAAAAGSVEQEYRDLYIRAVVRKGDVYNLPEYACTRMMFSGLGYFNDYLDTINKTFTAKDYCSGAIFYKMPHGRSVNLTIEVLDPPIITVAVSQPDGIRVDWEPNPNAQKYRIFRSDNNSYWHEVKTIVVSDYKREYGKEPTSFIDKDVAEGSSYRYSVMAASMDSQFRSDWYLDGERVIYSKKQQPTLSAPKLKSAENTSDGVKITWEKVSGAARYGVYVKSGSTWKAVGTTSDTSFVDKNAVYGVLNTYTVKCVNVSSTGEVTAASSFDTTGKSAVFVYLGDVNGDKKINVKDRICLARHLAKWSGYGTVGKEAADVNADGVVNAKDRVVLARYLAKWRGYDRLPKK